MRWKVALAPSLSSRDTARLWRNSDFGVITISGFRISRCSWGRSAWKEFAGVGRRGRIDPLHVVFGAHLQEALEPGRGMLRPLPSIAMRQQAYEAGHAQPF